jgi:hypothetical protein
MHFLNFIIIIFLYLCFRWRWIIPCIKQRRYPTNDYRCSIFN